MCVLFVVLGLRLNLSSCSVLVCKEGSGKKVKLLGVEEGASTVIVVSYVVVEQPVQLSENGSRTQ